MSERMSELPERLRPHVAMQTLNEPVLALSGPFELVGETAGTLESDLVFRWLPSAALVFDGAYSQPTVGVDSATDWTLKGDDPRFDVPVLVTGTTLGVEASVRGVVLKPLSVGEPRSRRCGSAWPTSQATSVKASPMSSTGRMGPCRVA